MLAIKMEKSSRTRGIGGSDVAAILGMSRYVSPIQLYMEKIGEWKREPAGEAAYWGTTLEDVVAQEFAKRTGKKVRRCNFQLQHPEYPFMVAHIDRGIVGEHAFLECKTTNQFNAHEWPEDSDDIPPAYLLQIQHYLAVTGYQTAHVACLIGGQRYTHKEIPRDDELIAYLIKVESEFWERVETRNPPEMDGSEASASLLKSLYPESNGEVVELDADLSEYDKAKAAVSVAKEELTRCENNLKNLLGMNEVGLIGERKITWKAQVSQRFDTDRFKTEHPEMYQDYLKESPSRPFRVK